MIEPAAFRLEPLAQDATLAEGHAWRSRIPLGCSPAAPVSRADRP